jgi:hypothetical protein
VQRQPAPVEKYAMIRVTTPASRDFGFDDDWVFTFNQNQPEVSESIVNPDLLWSHPFEPFTPSKEEEELNTLVSAALDSLERGLHADDSKEFDQIVTDMEIDNVEPLLDMNIDDYLGDDEQ